MPAGGEPIADNDDGWVTSAAWSPTLRTFVALALVRRGPERIGETVRVWDGLRGGDAEARIVPPCFLDPDGDRLHGA